MDNIPDEILLMICAKIRFKDLLHCVLVSKKWFHIINSDVRTMDRILLKITSKTLPMLDSQSDLTRNYRRLHLIRVKFSNLIGDKVQSLLQTVKHLSLIQCKLIQWQISSIFQQIFDACHSLDSLHIDCLSIDYYSDRAKKRIKYSANTDSVAGTVKYLKVSINDIRDAIAFFEELQPVNLTMETLAVELTENDEMLLCFHQDQLIDFFELLKRSYQEFLKELSISMAIDSSELVELITELLAMESLQLRILQIKSHLPIYKHQAAFEQLIKQQTSLRTLELANPLKQELFEVLGQHLLDLHTLKIRINADADGVYVIKHLSRFSNLKKLSVIAHGRFEIDFIFNLDQLKTLECFELKNYTNFLLSHPQNAQLNLQQLGCRLENLKSFSVTLVPVNAKTLQKVFKFMPNLEELQLTHTCNASDFKTLAENNVPEESIANLKRLHTLKIDDIAAENDRFLETMKLPLLRKLEFARADNDVFTSYDEYLDASEFRYLKIKYKTLKFLMDSCPLLLEIEDDEYGKTYERKKKSIQFKKTLGYQTSDSEDACEDSE